VFDYSVQLLATMIAGLAATLIVHFSIERVFYRPRFEPSSNGREQRTEVAVEKSYP
jgi:hypothetical protein